MHLMPVWYPYIDWEKSDLKVKGVKTGYTSRNQR